MRGNSVKTFIQTPPDLERNVFSRRYNRVEWLHLVIEEAVVHGLDDLFFKDLLEIFQVDYHARNRVGYTAYAHFDKVIVPVSVRMSGFAVSGAILVVAP